MHGRTHMSHLVDLDDLLLTVRSPEARAHITDAVVCYRGGAVRPAVVATWTAVVFDIIGKVRELELTGDTKARDFMKKFEQIRANNDVKASLDLERTILEEARDSFELLTHQEFADLDRVRQDRHRCAHPAMNTAEDPYQPSPELVRYHLRSAVTHLLAHPPVQGRAALARVQQEVESPLFPTTTEAALRILRAGPLQRPKPALLRDFVVATVKAVLLDATRGSDEAFVARAVAALLAAGKLHPVGVADVYATQLQKVLKVVRDEHLERVVVLGEHLDVVWTYMPDEVRLKLDQLIETTSAKAAPRLFRAALLAPALREKAEARIRTFSRVDLGALIDAAPRQVAASMAFIESALALLRSSMSFDAANLTIVRLLLPVAPALTREDFENLVHIADTNNQVEHAFELPGLFEAVRGAGVVDEEHFRKVLLDSTLRESLRSLAEGPAAADELEEAEATAETPGAPATPPLASEALQVGLRVQHRKFGDGTITALVGSGRDLKLRVTFDDETVGRKTLVAAQANLRALS